MTLLPCEQVRIGKGLDLEVDPQIVCVMPNCNLEDVELHHIVRRSHLAGPYTAVEIDGKPVPNVVAICGKHHLSLTENRAMIGFENDRFYWQSMPDGIPRMLFPQPRLAGAHIINLPVELPPGPAERRIEQNMEPCPKCKGKGRLKKRDEKLAKAPKRKYQTWAMGIPVDAGEDGKEIWENQLDACTEQVREILGYSETVPPYYVLVAVTSDWLASQPVTVTGD